MTSTNKKDQKILDDVLHQTDVRIAKYVKHLSETHPKKDLSKLELELFQKAKVGAFIDYPIFSVEQIQQCALIPQYVGELTIFASEPDPSKHKTSPFGMFYVPDKKTWKYEHNDGDNFVEGGIEGLMIDYNGLSYLKGTIRENLKSNSKAFKFKKYMLSIGNIPVTEIFRVAPKVLTEYHCERSLANTEEYKGTIISPTDQEAGQTSQTGQGRFTMRRDKTLKDSVYEKLGEYYKDHMKAMEYYDKYGRPPKTIFFSRNLY